MKMPGLSRKAHHPSSTSTSSSSLSGTTNDVRSSIWTRSSTEDVSFGQLQKFWNELPADARRKLLRIDKQTLFEQVRKNLYCSRCHGLLVEGFSQIVMYGKSLHSAVRGNAKSRKVFPENELSSDCSTLQDDARDPSLHPWGGLAATKDCMLTVLDCFVDGTPLEVFESARGRERERELLYPDACGGNGRGWISQTSVSYASGRGHGMKETCALHTARLSCEALVDFWSALSEETRRSLLRMKEEDFIERLMFRFDSKRFCRDCRRNVLREFKEMKELKRARKEPRCTRWFCAADTSFQYEVSDSSVQADWHDSFVGEVGTLYQHFEWALGTAEGKADIFGFEDVGLSESILMDGLELGGMADCFITIRAWRRDGRCTELSVKAHGLKGELCVHRRLFVGDGIVSITEGESIQRFFEHAEETEEEEDEDGLDKDGNELDGEVPRSQKHAKSPELARDFLLDAATVIFKEQVEKAFREGTARQNAHSIFVCLALGLLEDRVRVACKEIATLEKQNKLLEEEEHEKRKEEERRERRKLKEKEKKLRRKEKMKSKEREKDKAKGGTSPSTPSDRPEGELAVSSCMTEVRLVPDECESDHGSGRDCSVICSAACIEDSVSMRDGNGAFIIEQSKSAKRRSNGKRQQVVDSVPSRYARRGAGLAFERVNGRVSVDSNLQERQAAKDSQRIDGRNIISQSRQDSQQCACAATFWVKGGQQLCTGATSKVTRRTTVVDSSSKHLHKKAAGNLKGRVIAAVTPGSIQKVSAETVSVPAQVKSRTVCKEGLSYTKVVSRGWTGDERPTGVKQVQDVRSASDSGCPTSATLPVNPKEHANVDSQCELEKTLEVEAVVDAILGDRQPEPSASILELPLTDDDGHSSTTASCKVGNENLDSEVDTHCHCSDSPSNRSLPVEEEADSRRSESSTIPLQSSPASSMAASAIGNLYGMGSHAPVGTPDVGRNGYANGFVHGGQVGGKNRPYSVMEMLPVPGQIRHPVHMHPAQPGFGCYPVPHGPPWGPHQPRNSFIPPPSAPAAAAGFLIHGPAFGYPRYPVPRMLHPPMRMPPLLAEMGTLHMREVPPPRPGFTPWQAAASGAVDTSRPASSCLLPPRLPPGPAEMNLGEPMQTAAFSLQQGECGTDKQLHVLSDSSGFSLFHFSVPASNGVSTEFDSPTSAVSSEANEEEVVPEVSSKCMDRPPSGINKLSTGEYSLFAAAPGKAFGFF